MRLLQVIAELEPGGAERIVLQLTADAIREGDEASVASAGGAWVERLLATGGRHHTVGLAGRSSLGALTAGGRLARIIRRERPDVVHAHNVRATVAARAGIVLAGRPGTPLLTTLHGVAPTDYPSAARILRRAGKRVVGCAPAVGRSLAAAGFPEGRLGVITNGAALDPPTPARLETARAQFGLTNERPVVLGIGRLVDQKDWPTFIAATMALPADVDVIVAGDGPLRAQLERDGAVEGGRVRFAGAVDDLAALVGLATCVVSTSSWEGLPLSLLEAMSLGACVVATAVDGVTDVVPDTAAMLVAPRDPAAVAHAIAHLLADPAARLTLSSSARDASRAWAPETMLAEYRSLYEMLRSTGSSVRR